MLEERQRDLQLSSGTSHVGFSEEQLLDPNVMLRKGIYDKVAAKVVL